MAKQDYTAGLFTGALLGGSIMTLVLGVFALKRNREEEDEEEEGPMQLSVRIKHRSSSKSVGNKGKNNRRKSKRFKKP